MQPTTQPQYDPNEEVTLTGSKGTVKVVKRADLPTYGLPTDYISQADTYAKQVQKGIIGADSPNVPSQYRAGMLQTLDRTGFTPKRQAEVTGQVQAEQKKVKDEQDKQEAGKIVRDTFKANLQAFLDVPQSQKGALNPTAYTTNIPLVGKFTAGKAQEYQKGLMGVAPSLKDIITSKGSGLRLTQTEIKAWVDLLPNTTKTDAQNTYDVKRLNDLLIGHTGEGLDKEYLKKFGVTDKTETPKKGILDRLAQGAENDVQGLRGEHPLAAQLLGAGNPLAQTVINNASAISHPIQTAEGMVGGTANMLGFKSGQDEQGHLSIQAPKSVGEWGGNVVNNAIEHPVNTALTVGLPFLGGEKTPTGELPPITAEAPKAIPETVLPEIKTGGSALATDIGRNAFTSNFTIPSKLAKRININSVADTMIKNGHTGSLQDLSNVAQQVTGKNGILPSIVRDSLSQIKTPIKVNQAISTAVKGFDSIPELAGKQAQIRAFKSEILKIIKPGETIGTNDALSSLDAIQALEKRGYQYVNSSTRLTPNVTNERIGKVFLDTADEIKHNIEKAGGNEDVLSSVKTADNIAKIEAISPALAKEFINAKTVADLRKLQAPYVRLQQAIDLTNEASRTPFSQMSNQMSKGIGAAAGAAVGSVVPGVGTLAGGLVGGMAGPFIQPIIEAGLPPIMTKAGRFISKFGKNPPEDLPPITTNGAEIISKKK